MNKEKFINLELSGLIFTLLLGLILKYSIMIFGINLWTILISSVNKSIWEGIKVFALAYLIWACLEYCMIQVSIKEFVVSKVVGMYTLIILGIVFFLTIKSIPMISNILIETILIFIVVSLSFGISYKMMISKINLDDWFVLSLFFIALFFSMYFCFAINPPHIALFVDKNTYSYGILSCI